MLNPTQIHSILFSADSQETLTKESDKRWAQHTTMNKPTTQSSYILLL